MSKIEVGEYVRTKEGYLGILIAINKQDYNYLVVDTSIEVRKDGYPSTYLYLKKENIKKHSKQLIDLIEVGDVLEIRTGLYNSFKYFVENEDNLLLLKEQVKEFWDISIILTKEQFESNCYKVGGKDE